MTKRERKYNFGEYIYIYILYTGVYIYEIRMILFRFFLSADLKFWGRHSVNPNQKSLALVLVLFSAFHQSMNTHTA